MAQPGTSSWINNRTPSNTVKCYLHATVIYDTQVHTADWGQWHVVLVCLWATPVTLCMCLVSRAHILPGPHLYVLPSVLFLCHCPFVCMIDASLPLRIPHIVSLAYSVCLFFSVCIILCKCNICIKLQRIPSGLGSGVHAQVIHYTPTSPTQFYSIIIQ